MADRPRYFDGEEVHLGDKVRLADDDSGLVVAVITTSEGDENNPAEQWGYLETGAMIEFKKYGLHHYPDPSEEPDLSLIARKV